MLSFKQFILEWGDFSFPTATVIKDRIGISCDNTRQELNRNLALATTGHSVNPYTNWFRVTKILNLYGISLPKVTFKDMYEGEEIIPIDQFGARSGAEFDGTVEKLNNLDETQYFFYYCYEMKDDGHYETKGKIVNEDELGKLLEEPEEDSEDIKKE
jgi:hypothetical protein